MHRGDVRESVLETVSLQLATRKARVRSGVKVKVLSLPAAGRDHTTRIYPS